jgi:hypothetical protein
MSAHDGLHFTRLCNGIYQSYADYPNGSRNRERR